MIPIAELKQSLELNKSLGSIVETMKAGSAIQLREFQSKARASDKLFFMLKDCFETISKRGSIKHPLFSGGGDLPSCVVLVTSDDGFVGELNTFIMNTALELKRSADDVFIVLGERGANYFEDRGEKFTPLPGISEEIKPSEIRSVKDRIVEGYFKKRFGRVVIVYPESANVGSWKVVSTELLPFVAPKHVSPLENVPAAGAETDTQLKRLIDEELLIEPSIESVAEGLIQLWLDVTLYNIFWSSKFSEFGARLMQLEGSEQELVRMKQRLNLQYFKHVHETADTTIREILSARLGLKLEF